ncbi:hypothetical protein QUF49_14105 [Fictibacillus sp. b24]|uniref:hypothetical protein n=1 Tax=Fictibacillus sp. b24 TaxID=3055863 RepID=UPI0025A086AF|nr:hypothetical protein [Fictibacillus sp. b24]MDM5317137.1 hypothetical protein [Fictibacillus sp. b24]
MEKARKRSMTRTRSFRTPKTITLITMLFLMIVAIVSLFLSNSIYHEHLVLSEGLYWLGGSIFSLFMSIFLVHYKMEKVIEKIFVPLLIAGTLICSIVFAHTAVQLFRDKTAYDHEKFQSVEGIPSNITYDGSKNGRDYVATITIQGTTLHFAQQSILRSSFIEKYKNKPLKLAYLPRSKYAVAIEVLSEQQ